MAVDVYIAPVFRSDASSAVLRAGGTTVLNVISELEETLPGLRDRLIDTSGLRRYVSIYLQGTDIRLLAGLDTPVEAAGRLTILPASSGGMFLP